MHEHYVPAIESFQQHQADVVLLSETKTNWTKNDNHYKASTHNKIIY